MHFTAHSSEYFLYLIAVGLVIIYFHVICAAYCKVWWILMATIWNMIHVLSATIRKSPLRFVATFCFQSVDVPCHLRLRVFFCIYLLAKWPIQLQISVFTICTTYFFSSFCFKAEYFFSTDHHLMTVGTLYSAFTDYWIVYWFLKLCSF